MSRRTVLYPEIARLREEERLTWKEIGERFGLALQTVQGYYTDPTGARDRARKAKTDGWCVDCGCRTVGDGSYTPARCRPCENERQKAPGTRAERAYAGTPRWSDEEILAAIRSAASGGVVSQPMYAAAYARRPGCMPSLPTVIKRFDRWALAVEAAGLRTRGRVKDGPRSDRTPTRGLLLAIDECVAARELGRFPTYNEYEGWASEVGAISGQTIRNRFGTWLAAMDAYEAYLGEPR